MIENVTTPAKPEKRKRIIDLGLNELYERKQTQAVRSRIEALEDFNAISPRYCATVCTIPESEKVCDKITLYPHENVDIMFVFAHPALPGKFSSSAREQSSLDAILSTMIKEIGVPVRVSREFVSKCPPKTPTARKETQVRRCTPYLLAQIEKYKPKVIVTDNTATTKSLGLNLSNANDRGRVVPYNFTGGSTSVVLTAPLASLRMIRQNASGEFWGPDFYGLILHDLKKAAAIARGLYIPSMDEAIDRLKYGTRQVRVVDSIEEVIEFRDLMMSLPKDRVISWDLETNTLDAFKEGAKILTCQFGYRRDDGLVQSVVIPLWHRENKTIDPDVAWSYISDILLGDCDKVGHNVKFDAVFTEVTTGVRPRNLRFDTLLMLHSLNSGIQGNYSLKTAVWDHLLETGLGGYEDSMAIAEEEDDDEEIESLPWED